MSGKGGEKGVGAKYGAQGNRTTTHGRRNQHDAKNTHTQQHTKPGIPSTVVIAASFDDVVAITGFSIFINIAITGQENAAWQMATGPLQVLFGIAAGAAAGAALGCTRAFGTGAKRFVGIYASGENGGVVIDAAARVALFCVLFVSLVGWSGRDREKENRHTRKK